MKNMRTKEEIMESYKNMPTLIGSTKQIEWAEKIRKSLFYTVGLFMDEYECERLHRENITFLDNMMLKDRFDDIETDFTKENVEREINRAINSIFKEIKAAIWIDLRDQRACLRICEEIEFLVTGEYSWDKF